MSTDIVSRSLPVRRKSEACCVAVKAPRLTQEQTDRVASRLKAPADSTRLGMLDLLAQQEEALCVCDLTDRFPQNQPTISHHLRLLREAGLIDTEKRGIWAYYWATEVGKEVLASVHVLV